LKVFDPLAIFLQVVATEALPRSLPLDYFCLDTGYGVNVAKSTSKPAEIVPTLCLSGKRTAGGSGQPSVPNNLSEAR
jgi:hypothetical protein